MTARIKPCFPSTLLGSYPDFGELAPSSLCLSPEIGSFGFKGSAAPLSTPLSPALRSQDIFSEPPELPVWTQSPFFWYLRSSLSTIFDTSLWLWHEFYWEGICNLLLLSQVQPPQTKRAGPEEQSSNNLKQNVFRWCDKGCGERNGAPDENDIADSWCATVTCFFFSAAFFFLVGKLIFFCSLYFLSCWNTYFQWDKRLSKEQVLELTTLCRRALTKGADDRNTKGAN